MWCVSMLSRRLSHVWVRKGSIDRLREAKLGVRVSDLRIGLRSKAEREDGGWDMTPAVRSLGIECRKVVTRWELWIWIGSSWMMS